MYRLIRGSIIVVTIIGCLAIVGHAIYSDITRCRTKPTPPVAKKQPEIQYQIPIVIPQQYIEVTDSLSRWGYPTEPDYEEAFAFAYDGWTRTSRWTLEVLNKTKLAGASSDDRYFHETANIPTEFKVSPRYYEGLAFDKGHLVPLADMRGKAAIATCQMANVAPMYPSFNRGRWAKLEKYMRDLGTIDGITLWVHTVPLFLPTPLPRDGQEIADTVITHAGPHGIPVPTHYAKVVLIDDNGKRRMTAWVIPHTPHPADALDTFLVPVDSVETWAGLNFFSKMEYPEQGRLEEANPKIRTDPAAHQGPRMFEVEGPEPVFDDNFVP